MKKEFQKQNTHVVVMVM